MASKDATRHSKLELKSGATLSALSSRLHSPPVPLIASHIQWKYTRFEIESIRERVGDIGTSIESLM